MGKFQGVLLASDYDDTLYSTHDTISEKDRIAIEYFIREGGYFCIATGRSYGNFSIQLERENIPVNSPTILYNGAMIHDFRTGKTIRNCPLPIESMQHIRLVCDTFPEVGFEAYHGEDIYLFRENDMTHKHLNRCFLTGTAMEIENMPTPWTKIILQHRQYELLLKVQKFMLDRWADFYEVTFSNHYLLEVTAKSADKGSAVRFLSKYLNTAPENVYCVGNGLNDIPMLQVSAVPFAPSNAYPEIKKWGAHMLPSCDENCIAELIRILDERYTR